MGRRAFADVPLTLPGTWANGWMGDVLNRRRPAVALMGTADAPMASVEVRPARSSDAPTLFAFAGLAHQLMMAPETFLASLGDRDLHVLFVKDLRQAWYQRGLRGLASTPPGAATALRSLVPAGSRVVGALGTSAGATGAILMGGLMGLDRVVAFSPSDIVTKEIVRANRAAGTPVPRLPLRLPYCDLVALLREYPVASVDVHVGRGNVGDWAAAERLATVPGVRVVSHPTDEHTSAQHLASTGTLGEILTTALALDRP